LGVGYTLNLLGEVARCQSDYIEARSFYEQALPVWRELRDDRGVAVILDNLGRVAGHLGDYERAEAILSEALRIRRKFGFMLGVATTLAGLAGVASARMQPDRAARLLGASAALLSSLGATLYRADRQEYDRTMSAVQTALGEARYVAALDEGKRMPLDQAIEFAATAHEPIDVWLSRPGVAPN
jgi:tetratricopeptide (TPR) repeat protein